MVNRDSMMTNDTMMLKHDSTMVKLDSTMMKNDITLVMMMHCRTVYGTERICRTCDIFGPNMSHV